MRQQAQKPVPPCAECGTREGWPEPSTGRPKRISGAKYGVDGMLCHRCDNRRAYYHRRGLPSPPRQPPKVSKPRQLAAAVLALDAAMQTEDVQEQSRQYAAAVALARTVATGRV